MTTPTVRPLRASCISCERSLVMCLYPSVHVAVIDALGEFRLAARGQDLGLFDPVVAAHTALEALDIAIHPGHLFGPPAGDLVEMIKAHLVEHGFQFRADALDFLEVVGLSALRRR